MIVLCLLQALAAKKEKEAQKKVLKKERKSFRTAMKVKILDVSSSCNLEYCIKFLSECCQRACADLMAM